MNLFYTNRDPQLCAQDHCDKHVVKMILEYAQLLSTAHRLLDGKHVTAEVLLPNNKVKKIQAWLLEGEIAVTKVFAEEGKRPTARFEIYHGQKCYAVAHAHHPLSHWSRAASENYKFLYQLFVELCKEYTHRYGKVHSAEKLIQFLAQLPKNVPAGEMVDPPLSMPDEYKVNDAVISYQNLYVGSKSRFAKWTNRKPPEWFIQRIPEYNETNFERTRAMAE